MLRPTVFLFSVANNRNCEALKYAGFNFPITSSTSGPCVFFSILSPSTSYNANHQVSDPYKTTATVQYCTYIVYCIHSPILYVYCIYSSILYVYCILYIQSNIVRILYIVYTVQYFTYFVYCIHSPILYLYCILYTQSNIVRILYIVYTVQYCTILYIVYTVQYCTYIVTFMFLDIRQNRWIWKEQQCFFLVNAMSIL